MIEVDNSDTVQLVQNKRTESTEYIRQWILWLGVGSAGGAVATISLAAKLPDPDFAFRLFVPSLWAFLVGVLSASASLLIAALRARAAGEHFASTHNRDQLKNAIRRIPETLAYPQSRADRENFQRNELVREAKAHHDQAEAAWTWRVRWQAVMVALLVIGAIAFTSGVGAPLVYISSGGSLLPPSKPIEYIGQKRVSSAEPVSRADIYSHNLADSPPPTPTVAPNKFGLAATLK